MKNNKDCPLCGDEVISDATAKEYCALCGMIIKDKPAAVMKFEQGIKYFCSEQCNKKYAQFHVK